jgi:hypothetical protein
MKWIMKPFQRGKQSLVNCSAVSLQLALHSKVSSTAVIKINLFGGLSTASTMDGSENAKTDSLDDAQHR